MPLLGGRAARFERRGGRAPRRSPAARAAFPAVSRPPCVRGGGGAGPAGPAARASAPAAVRARDAVAQAAPLGAPALDAAGAGRPRRGRGGGTCPCPCFARWTPCAFISCIFDGGGKGLSRRVYRATPAQLLARGVHPPGPCACVVPEPRVGRCCRQTGGLNCPTRSEKVWLGGRPKLPDEPKGGRADWTCLPKLQVNAAADPSRNAPIFGDFGLFAVVIFGRAHR